MFWHCRAGFYSSLLQTSAASSAEAMLAAQEEALQVLGQPDAILEASVFDAIQK